MIAMKRILPRLLMLVLLAGWIAHDDPKTIVLEPKGDQLLFATTEITAKAGTEVKLVFKNTATNAAMIHNFTLLTPKADINAVGIAAIQAGEAKDFIPEHDAILAYTPMAKPGETVEVTFTVPPPGDYPYVCIYPGHYVVMRGVLHSVE